MALEPTQLLWLDSLPKNIIDSCPTLRRLFIDNFQGVMTRAGTRHDLAQCKQNKNESLRDYIKRFFEKCATVSNITEANIIDYYHQGRSDRNIFRDFDHQQPRSIMELHVMMTKWAKNEEEEYDRFPRRADDNNNKRSNNNRGKGPRDQLDQNGKCRPDDHVATLDRPQGGKKLSTQEQFEKLLNKRCPFHPNGKHSAKGCRNLQQAVTSFAPENDNRKKKDKEDNSDKECADKAMGYQDPSRTVNVIFGGDSCLSKRLEKLTL